ncbi:MAG TPA: lytic transglycosylase domain-containing protein [Vicinamibacterales bacterium]|nr:lytic transglycosylase domain-containing protein [Vicinamibacterales bacterium]
MQLTRLWALGAVLFGLGVVSPASAELVFLTSGRTLSVSNHRDDGQVIVLGLRSGGEVTIARSLVERIEADEVPYPEPQVPDAKEATASGPAALLGQVPYSELIENLSAAHGVDANLVKALIKVESGYRPRARSSKGAMGLMQIMPSTAKRYAVRNPYEPKANLEAGIRHLASLLQRFEVSAALAAYNAGEAAVRRFGGVPPYRETRNYVKRILAMISPQP